MVQKLQRIPVTCAPQHGLLRAEHFQLAYATNDLDQACELFSRQLGISAFASLGGPMAEGGEMQARFAWVGTVMYEIICAKGAGGEIFNAPLAGATGFAIRQHHLGFLIPDEAARDAVHAAAAREGWQVPWRSVNPLVEACFVRVPELPHLLEYLLPTAAGMAFFESVPRS